MDVLIIIERPEDPCVAAPFLDLISLEKVVWAGLQRLIITYRPLTFQEFADALKHEEIDVARAIINHDQATLYTVTVFELVSLFYRLVEVNENRICQ